MAFDDFGFDGFDSSGGFGSDDPFGDFNPGGANNNQNSGFNAGGFDDGPGFGSNNSFDMQNSGFDDGQSNFGDDMGNGQFSGMFNQNNIGADDDNSKDNLKKTAIIAAIAGVVIILVVILGAGLLKKKDKQEEVSSHGVTIVEQQQTVQQVQQPTQQVQVQPNADSIMQSGNEPESNKTVDVNKKDGGWTVIDGNQTIEFNSEYRELMFYITGIEHRAKVEGNSVVVKTVLTGSLSGMSGTYEMDVPYNKGSQLTEGQEFRVYVLLGNFNGKTVVGDIKY